MYCFPVAYEQPGESSDEDYDQEETLSILIANLLAMLLPFIEFIPFLFCKRVHCTNNMSNMGKRQMNEERESVNVRKNMEARLKQMNE